MVDFSYLKRRTVLLKAVIYSLSIHLLDCGHFLGKSRLDTGKSR
jgi:hypothetical protein